VFVKPDGSTETHPGHIGPERMLELMEQVD
jgi:hypothetical protein